MSVRPLQQRLQSIYELSVAHDVDDFLVSKTVAETGVFESLNNSHLKEKLLLHQQADELQVGLYLAEDVLQKLAADNPSECLHEGNLEAYCLALEGVSHFLYLIWNAGFERSVTLLEMELQAEIDKFVMLAFSFEDQNQSPAPGRLRKLLFETAGYHSQLNDEEHQRYQDASHFAEKYCWKLETDYLQSRNKQLMLSELRQFYRLPQGEKLRRINQLQ